MSRLLSIFGCGLLASALVVGCSEASRPARPPDTAAVTNALRAIVATFAPEGDYRRIDVTDLRTEDFRRELAGVSPRATLWMPGERDWLIVGVRQGASNTLERAMEDFALQDSRLSFPEVFCAYVGTVAEVLPAFAALDAAAVVGPQNFVTCEVPTLSWLDGSGVDEDIRKATMAEIRSVQLVRREVIKGNMLAAKAKDRKGEQAAIEQWSRAAKRNPADTFLAERLERLDRNARGFLHLGKVLPAMKCYETMMLIRPTAVSVHNFGMCLKKIGKLDLAEKVLAQAREMEKAEVGSR